MAKNTGFLKQVLWLIIIISAGIFLFSGFKQIKRWESEKRFENISSILEKPEVKVTPITQPTIEENKAPEKIYFLEPNAQKQWLDINPDYQGWLSIKGTNIDYPTVRAKDNQFYLDRDFLKEKSELGAIFMDYRNVGNFNDRHTAIYGHYTWNGKMFADLHNYKDESFGRDHNIIKLNTLYGEKEFQIFSIYVDSATDYKLRFNFKDDEDYKEYLNGLKELSLYELPFELEEDKLLLTLATCSYEVGNGRLIVHGIEK